MSVDALAFDVVKGAENVSGKLLERVAITTFSAGYPAGGYTFPRALSTQYGQLGIADLIAVQVIAIRTSAIAYLVVWDIQAETLVVIDNTTGLEVADNVDLHLITVTIRLTGTR